MYLFFLYNAFINCSFTDSYDFVSLNHYMSFEVTDLPTNETGGKSISELDLNIKKLILKSDEELASHPWCKVKY